MAWIAKFGAGGFMSDKRAARIFGALVALCAARVWQLVAIGAGILGAATIGPEGAAIAAGAFLVLQANLPLPPD